ncbi:MAG: histidine kinase [Deltaproteobacteria bacterium]|nr:MAG: histidine kinase [Deltaproteobacteria bacterium]
MAHILVVDDEDKMRHLLSMMLERNGHRVDDASDGVDAWSKIQSVPFDMVITDIKMPRMSGVELLDKVKKKGLSCPVVFITAFATVESAVEAMRGGAADYITKPFDEERIQLTVARTLNLSRVMSENRELRRKLAQVSGADAIVHDSPAMDRVMALAGKVARSDSVVLITGESGTGKELLARFIHHASNRRADRFVAINCAAISSQLVESELFGYEKGAFTGADRQTQGKFEFASNGTLFMDEIGDLPLEAQAKLLRTLQEQTVRRVGGNREISVDVRIVCATNQNLTELVENGRFRQDLFFRINVVPIELPPLRERREDILPLCTHFLQKFGEGRSLELTDSAVRLLTRYSWPGNVRELANTMERATIFGPEKGGITAETLAFLKGQNSGGGGANGFQLPPQGISMDALMGDLVNQSLALAGNNQTRAAELLGVTRARFRVLMKNALGDK